ncbi:phage tail protein [Rhizobiales bacterium RZME27]|uniref:Phage tail protein n=1 Tax=Endobacterium cereale TaxID=2663029 RepID=A0A6A8A117_9HYPH|nr:tail protein X [Endobacterium cereale]MQY44515.1 phage tail protein [Endobacterium cereale]
MSTIVTAKQGQTVDLICLMHYGRTAEVTELVLAANPDLAAVGIILPLGTKVFMPVAPSRQQAAKLTSLWE